MTEGPSFLRFLSAEVGPVPRWQRFAAWIALVGAVELAQLALFACNDLVLPAVVATAVAVGAPGAFLVGLAPLPSRAAWRLAVALAVLAVTIAAAGAALLTHMCP